MRLCAALNADETKAGAGTLRLFVLWKFFLTGRRPEMKAEREKVHPDV
jgi:hypothetical protein